MLLAHPTPIVFEMDVDLQLPNPSPRLKEILQSLLGQALEQMLDGGELNVTAQRVGDTIELEIADSGEGVEERSQRIPMAAAAIGATIDWQNCPQGGAATTIRFPFVNTNADQVQERGRRAA